MILKKVKLSVLPEICAKAHSHFSLFCLRAPFLILTSVLFLFFAAILDLARISLQHDNTGPERNGTRGITRSLGTVREALSSTSAGLRFLYFWAFVAQPPLCELATDSFLRLHSGSWLHWGLTGRVLRWTTLASSIAILALQVVWRLMTQRWTCLQRRKFPRDINLIGLYSQVVSEFTDCRATLSAANTLAVLDHIICPTHKFGRRDWEPRTL